uniref:Uncharacterized protein n=1 Tax=Ciona savignyi TaxID=51511 RepID=H2ZF18_CIOSA
MLKATGQPRGFPESTMEMDVTPKLKKTGTRGRKRTLKSKEDGEIKSDASNEAETTKTRSRRRGKVVQEPEEPATNKIPNMARMGDILKNSPVGQALKRFEAAISPSRSPTITSPATALNYNDQNRQSTRRVRKLHADDISLPLECTPNENSALGTPGRGVAVLSQTQNVDRPGSRRLRKRK